MKSRKKVLTSILATTLSLSVLAACGNNNNNNASPSASDSPSSGSPAASSAAPEAAKDTITALLPPISPKYQESIAQIEKDFNALYPNLTLKIEPAGWEDMTQKLDTQVNAGSPPDIAFIGSSSIPKYLEQGMLMDITDSVTPEMIADYNPAVTLDYMKSGAGLYGFPAYMVVHSIGGNKQYLEEAGVDWKKVQQEGWTYEQFREAIKSGAAGGKHYGFVFATAGVAARDYLTILAKNAGMADPFTKDLKFAYTSKNYLEVLKAVRQMIDDGSMPKELSSVDAGKRWNMFLTGQTMITGKGLATFENSAKANNAKLEANDGSAVKDSIKVDYIVLPVPTFAGAQPVSTTVIDGYVTFRGKKEPTAEHKANVAKAAYYLASGKVAAVTNNDLFASHITESAKAAAASLTIERSAENLAAVERMLTFATPPRPDIPAELSAKAIKLEDEVIIPKMQALLANEITPEKMYDEVMKAAVKEFGADGVVQD